jgi:hypothetical protein
MKYISTFLLLILITSACNNSKKDELLREQLALKEKASKIDNDFKKIRLEVHTLAALITKLYERQDEILPHVDKKKYRLESNGVFTKPVDDGGSAIFVSGFYPVTAKIRKTVYFTEPIDTIFKALVAKYPEIVQVYYNDKYSLNRIYPYFDVLSQYEVKMDIPGFNFYYLADEKHNPARKSLWISEPYVDPAGRGWMVSAIAPVYFGGSMEGVPGIDVTINTITKRYVLDNNSSMTIIIDNSGAIVAAQEGTINLLSFPPLFDHKYIGTIKQDTYRKELYNMALSKEPNVRKIANEILKEKRELVETEIKGEKITILASHIPELNWYLLEILK